MSGGKASQSKANKVSAAGLRIVIVSSYPPRNCGIARFCSDLRNGLVSAPGVKEVSIYALNNTAEGYDYPPEVVYQINQNNLKDYQDAASVINLSNIDVVIVQHEFGLYGGSEGAFIGHFLTLIKKPVITTLHTVLKDPSPAYRDSMLKVLRYSTKIAALTEYSATLLNSVYNISSRNIVVIPHGVPDVPFERNEQLKKRLNIQDRFAIFTCGLISPSKGVEYLLDATAAVVKKHPEAACIVLGATHPEILKRQGEKYRNALERQVRDLGIVDHVMFKNSFVKDEEMIRFMQMADVLVTPYPSKEQVASGNLAHAMGVGMAVISTPYYHAEEMLADGRGLLVEFNSPSSIAAAINSLIENPKKLTAIRKKAYAYGQEMIWSAMSRRYAAVARDLAKKEIERPVLKFPKIYPIPEVNINHLAWMTDDTGVLQHTLFGVADPRYGYSTDDVSRALIVACKHNKMFHDEISFNMVRKYLGFLLFSQRTDGCFNNMLTYDRRFIDYTASEDTFGRVIWSLGYAMTFVPHQDVRFSGLARQIFNRSLDAMGGVTHPRAQAYTLEGLCYRHRAEPENQRVKDWIIHLADDLMRRYRENSETDWRWFDDHVTYGNALLPDALLKVYLATGREDIRDVALESLDFLTRHQYSDGYFDLIGNSGWLKRGGERAVFGQQPIDAAYLTRAYLRAYQVSQDEKYKHLAHSVFEWFFGRNRVRQPLYDFATGACADGIEDDGVNLNQGAESVICFLLAHLSFVKAQTYWRVAHENIQAPQSS